MTSDLGPVRKVPIGSIELAGDNPRKIPKRAIEVVAASLKEFGWQQPIVVDVNGVVLAGHTRLQAARYLKLKEVPVTVAENLTPQQAKAYRIADNRTGDFSSWDFPELTQQLEELSSEYSEVLALADWKTIIGDFEASQAKAEAAKLNLSEESLNYLSSEYTVTVVCSSEEAARYVSAKIIDMDGVVDVRNKQ